MLGCWLLQKHESRGREKLATFECSPVDREAAKGEPFAEEQPLSTSLHHQHVIVQSHHKFLRGNGIGNRWTTARYDPNPSRPRVQPPPASDAESCTSPDPARQRIGPCSDSRASLSTPLCCTAKQSLPDLQWLSRMESRRHNGITDGSKICNAISLRKKTFS